MKKKTRSIITSILFLATIGCFCVGCTSGDGDGSSDKGFVEDTKYNWGYEPVVYDICDEDMTIDGVLNEDRWKDKKYLVHEDDGVVMEYTTAFSQKGLYFAAKVQDDDIQWYVKKNYEANSSFWLSIKGPDVTYKYNTQEFTLFIDPVCANMVQMTKYQAVAKTNKPMEEHPTEMTAEAFLSWDTLNIELGENGELPEYVLINPHYRHVVGSGSGDNAWLRPLLFFDDVNRQQNSGKFGADGYLNPDAEGAIIGNAGNGISKSDGWDVSKEPEGIVRSVNDHSQAIFFKNAYSTAYKFETTLQVVKGLGYQVDTETQLLTETKKPPSGVGVVNMVDEVSLKAFLLNGAELLESAPKIRYNSLAFNVNGRAGWKDMQLGQTPVQYEAPSTVTITCIKNGGNFYYIVNGSLVYTDYVSYLNEESCPGFFAIDSEVIFTDYSFEDFSDEPNRLADILEDYGCHMVSVNSATEGGKLVSSSGAVDDGGEVSVTISPSSGYLMTDFTVNGEDYFDTVMNGMSNGVYTFTNVKKALSIDAKFTPISRDLLVYVMGKVTNPDGVVVGSAVITVDDLAGRYHLEAGVSATGVFRIGLPKTGTFELGGREFNFDGKYTISAEAAGYHGIGKSITIAEGSTGVSDFNFTLSKVAASEMQTLTTPDGKVYYSPASGWQTHSVIYPNESKKASTAVYKVEVTAKNGIQFAEWGWTGVGITVTNGNKISGEHYYDVLGTQRNVPTNNNYNALFGFDATTGIVAYSGFNMNMNNNINRSVAVPSSESPTKTITLLLINDAFYLLVEDKYIASWAITDALFRPKNADGNDTTNAKFSAGDKFAFGVGAYNLSELAPVSIRVVEEKYDQEALTEINTNKTYREIFYPSNIGVEDKGNGEYKMPTGWVNYGYAMTSTELTDTAVYSVKIKSPQGLKYSDAFYTNVGITFSNGEQFGSSNWYTYFDPERKTPRGSGCSNWYAGATIGLGNNSVVSGNYIVMTSGAMSTAGSKSAEQWPLIGSSLDGDITEKTLTIVFYEHMLYIFLDNQYINKVALTDSAFTWKNGNGETKQFGANDKLMFGVSAVNLSTATPTTITVLEELYGAEALAEIQGNELYQAGISYDEWTQSTPIMSRRSEENADGSYTLAWSSTALGGMAYQYFEGASDAAVFSVDITMPTSEIYQTTETYSGNISPRVGITVTNKSLLAGTYDNGNSLVTPGEYQSSQFAFFKANGAQTLCTAIDGFKNKGRDMVSIPGYEIKTGGFSLTKETSNLTIVLYHQKFYAFVDGVYVYSWSVTDALLSSEYSVGDKVISKPYAATDSFMFGICANGTDQWSANFKVVKNLYGADAEQEINANATYREQVYPSNVGVEDKGNGVYGMPTGWVNYGYAMTSTELTDTAVYSVKIQSPQGLKYSDAFYTNVGITFSNGERFGSSNWYAYWDTNRTAPRGNNACLDWYAGATIGLGNNSVVSGNYIVMTSGAMSTAGSKSAEQWPLIGSSLDGDITEKTLTIVFYEHMLYIFLDNQYINKVALTDSAFTWKNGNGETKQFGANDKLMFGVSAVNLSAATPTTITVLEELYGDDALAEIQGSELYQAGINYDEWTQSTPIMSRRSEENTDGSYTLAWSSTALGGMAYQYIEGEGDMAVFSVDITMPTSEIYQTILGPRVGITVTNKSLLAGTYDNGNLLVTPGEYQSSQFTFFKVNGTQTLCTAIDGFKNRGRDMGSIPGYEIKTGGFSLTKETSNLTIVLYNQKFYAYVDGAFLYSWDVTDSLLSTEYSVGGKVISKPYAATDKFMFGICANGTDQWSADFKVVKNLYGADAEQEIKTNNTYSNISPYYKNMNKNADGSLTTATKAGASYGYAFTTATPQTTAVYSVTLTANEGLTANTWWGSAGIIASNGQVVEFDENLTFTDWLGSTRPLTPNTYYGSTFSIDSAYGCAIVSGNGMEYANTYESCYPDMQYAVDGTTLGSLKIPADATDKTRKLTLVLYNDTFYYYVDDVLIITVATTSEYLDARNQQVNNKTYANQTGDSFIFGVAQYNSLYYVNFSNIVEKYGDDALTELTSNSIYAQVGATIA